MSSYVVMTFVEEALDVVSQVAQRAELILQLRELSIYNQQCTDARTCSVLITTWYQLHAVRTLFDTWKRPRQRKRRHVLLMCKRVLHTDDTPILSGFL